MCISPSNVWVQRGPEWVQQPTACRICWRCKENRKNDYIGRCLAEASTSAFSCAITLTYAPRYHDLDDKIINPHHFQLFMKVLRKRGHKVRYLVAGEYGSLRDRAHFHAILFFTHIEPLRDGETVPAYNKPAPFCQQVPHKEMCHISDWPHGHVLVDWSVDTRSAAYVCKYLVDDDKKNIWFSLSKKPALGSAFFAQKAALSRQYGVLPSTFEYQPPSGNPNKIYLMTGATRRDYLNQITQDPSLKPRMSEWVGKTFDKHHRSRLLAEAELTPFSPNHFDEEKFLPAKNRLSALHQDVKDLYFLSKNQFLDKKALFVDAEITEMYHLELSNLRAIYMPTPRPQRSLYFLNITLMHLKDALLHGQEIDNYIFASKQTDSHIQSIPRCSRPQCSICNTPQSGIYRTKA